MVTPTVSIRPLFAVPTGHARLEKPERLNAALEALFLAREGDDTRNPTPSHRPQDELFESRFNLFRCHFCSIYLSPNPPHLLHIT